MKKFYTGFSSAAFCALLLLSSCEKDKTEKTYTATFNDLSLAADTFWNGADGSQKFNSGGLTFYNAYNAQWLSWSGFSYSNQHDLTTPGYGNQFSAYVENDSAANIFAVMYPSNTSDTLSSLIFPGPVKNLSFKVANSSVAALSMQNGDGFAKKFGGNDGNDPDWFKLTITLYDANSDSVGASEVYLADYRPAINSNDYILNTWEKVDLSGFQDIKRIKFSLSSSDTGNYGMNTPSYFCLDDISWQVQ